MGEIKSIPINKIVVTEENPRQTFDEESLIRLGESIKSHGLIQPIVVRPRENYYELVVGERRLRAAELVGMKEIEARIEEIDDATLMELRLIENTQREDLTNAEKGDAVFTLWERFPDKYPTIKSVAEGINVPYGTVRNWCAKSAKLSEHVRELITRGQLTERASQYLLKYDHATQNKLANAIVAFDIRGGREGAERRFFRLFNENPKADLRELAEEAKGIKTVRVPIEELSEEARKEIEEVLEEREERIEQAREEALKQAQRAPRRKRPEIAPTEVVLEKAERLSSEIRTTPLPQRYELTRKVEKSLDYLTRKVELERQIAEDEEMRKLFEKWRANIVHKVEEETPERFVMNLTELVHGIWSRIGVEYPSSVKELGRRELVKTLSVKQLERLDETVKTTIEELKDFQGIIDSELFSRRTKAR